MLHQPDPAEAVRPLPRPGVIPHQAGALQLLPGLTPLRAEALQHQVVPTLHPAGVLAAATGHLQEQAEAVVLADLLQVHPAHHHQEHQGHHPQAPGAVAVAAAGKQNGLRVKDVPQVGASFLNPSLNRFNKLRLMRT